MTIAAAAGLRLWSWLCPGGLLAVLALLAVSWQGEAGLRNALVRRAEASVGESGRRHRQSDFLQVAVGESASSASARRGRLEHVSTSGDVRPSVPIMT